MIWLTFFVSFSICNLTRVYFWRCLTGSDAPRTRYGRGVHFQPPGPRAQILLCPPPSSYSTSSHKEALPALGLALRHPTRRTPAVAYSVCDEPWVVVSRDSQVSVIQSGVQEDESIFFVFILCFWRFDWFWRNLLFCIFLCLFCLFLWFLLENFPDNEEFIIFPNFPLKPIFFCINWSKMHISVQNEKRLWHRWKRYSPAEKSTHFCLFLFLTQ